MHEAGHAIAALAVGHRLELVSVLPSDRHRGFVYHRDPDAEAGTLPLTRPGASVLFQSPEARRSVERAMLVTLAGVAAELVIPEPHSGFYSSVDDDAAERLAHSLAELTPTHRGLLVEAESASSDVSDDDHAARLAEILTKHEAFHHLALMRAVAQRFVLSEGERIVRLANELARRPVMTGAEVVDSLALE